MCDIITSTAITVTDADNNNNVDGTKSKVSTHNTEEEIQAIDDHNNKEYLRIKEMHPQLKREVTRHRFPGNSGIDVIVMPATPRSSPVEGLKPKVLRKPQDLDLRLGEDAEFEVVVSDSKNVSVSWSKNGQPLFGTGRVQIGNTDDVFYFRLSKVELNDESLYECRIRNDYGEVLHDVQLLVDDDESGDESDETEEDSKVKPAKFLKKLMPEYTVHDGDVLLLEVLVEGNPSLKVSWYYDNQKLLSSGDIVISSVRNRHSLRIQEVLYDDEGCYKCIVSNEGGEDVCEANVFVEE